MDVTKYDVPALNVNAMLECRRTEWDQAYDQNCRLFAKKISESFATEVFKDLKNIFEDPFSLLPTKERAFKLVLHVDFLVSYHAERLKNLAAEASVLPPFNQWFARFIKNKQKAVDDTPGLCDVSCGPLSNSSSLTWQQENAVIESSYFKDRTALIGELVESQLKVIFAEFRSRPENQKLNFSVTWLGGLAGLPSMRDESTIEVECWLEKDNQIKPLGQSSETMRLIEEQQKQRRRQKLRTQAIQICLVVVVVGFFISILHIFPPRKK